MNIAQDIGASDDEAECRRQLAECYLEIDDPERAMTACREALKRVKEVGDRGEEGVIYRVLGNACLQLGDPTSALAHLERSVMILEGLNQELHLGTALYDYAQALIRLGRTPLASEQLSVAMDLFERLGLPREQARVQATLDQIA